MKKFLFIFTGLILTYFVLTDSSSPLNISSNRAPHPGAVEQEPQQVQITTPSKIKMGAYTIHELAKFRIRARILSKTNYHMGRETDLSPTDLALGWQKMSDLKVLDKISISQSGRWYYWRTSNFPIPRRDIETMSANMHLIPANDAIEDQIEETQEGDIIEITGSLVKVTSNTDNWNWKSSLTRSDTGNGACEVILVKELKITGTNEAQVR
ncbi:hypothetical protein PQO01_01290 [Lentisphaera marina]|uniref:hypothetical protein n=1 Tax=Lentisphaera marina TaxID=1111041 RepID=UPI002366B4C1|nr:hypothetical protein [Lentisphaera marina]MDD7983582.1 hypothetical protein [Lentisphaera marina]